ncbi:hypothetical protein MTsPCn5_06860 [Croceitalea sp. MTPC5]|uniref:hypothetical protein n=1 Tax=Croceitalea sp. MTPC5 TaxID=3056565 RepID=UPI002B3AD0AE|nr:hypothetical protein MTsPCn5_06860 [Croceitalea sp. MTPC5]
MKVEELTKEEVKKINAGLPYCGSEKHNLTSFLLNALAPGLGGLYDLGHLVGSE